MNYQMPRNFGGLIAGFLLFNPQLCPAANDVSSLPVPWPPVEKVSESPFAGMTCDSYSPATDSGGRINPKWGDEIPTDFGSRKVTFDLSGIRAVNQIPEPGIHPRIYCTPADLSDIRRRLKETHCGQEAWKNLLCLTNMMKGKYDPKADYAQLGVDAQPQDRFGSRVQLTRIGTTKNSEAAAKYQALIQGDLTQDVRGFWPVFELEAFRCWIEDDKAAATDLAAAISTAVKIAQAKRASASMGKDLPPGQPIGGIRLAATYDFLYNYLSSEQRKNFHDELANGSWSHDNYGTFNAAEASRSNWATFSYWLIEVLAIEGEPGFNDLKVRGMYRGWRNLYTYGWFESGATFEGEAKDQLGMDGVLMFALRSQAYGFENLAGHPYLRAYATNFLPKSVLPGGNGFVKYDLLGGVHGRPLPADLIGLKYLIPNDKVIDWAYRMAVGEHYENLPNRSEIGWFNAEDGGGYADPLLPFLIYASDFDPANSNPQSLGISNTFFCGERALMMTRSSWDKDALMLNLHVRGANGGHPFADRNSIMLAGAGRVWASMNGWADRCSLNIHNSEVVIDDHPQNEHVPARMVDFSDQPDATFAVGDAKYAWDWDWHNIPPNGKLSFSADDFTSGSVVPKSGEELDPHCINDFSFLKRDFAYLNAPFNRGVPSWLMRKGAFDAIARKPNYPVERAFRTAGLVRGKHPYALVIDDIQKDDQAHDYNWYMNLEYDVQIAKLQKINDHQIDLILTGADPSQVHAPVVGGRQKDPPLTPSLADPSKIPTGQPMLLVRFLNLNNTEPDKIATEAKTPTILEDAVPPNSSGHAANRVRRLAVPVRAVSPDFKVLLFPYHQGDVLPITTSSGTNAVNVAWPDQVDQIGFSPSTTGKTDVSVTRGGEKLVTLNKPIAPLKESK